MSCVEESEIAAVAYGGKDRCAEVPLLIASGVDVLPVGDLGDQKRDGFTAGGGLEEKW